MAQGTVVLDTNAAIEELADAGIPREHAAAQVRLTARLIQENFATSTDFEHLELSVGKQIAELRTEFRTEIAGLETRMTEKIDQLTNRLSDREFDTIRWTAGMQIGTILAIIAAIKLL